MNQIDLINELERRKSNTTKILEYLKKYGQATNEELERIGGFRYGARIQELRKEGNQIITVREQGGLFRYTLKGDENGTN